MRIPAAESNEFPNDNPALHQGASWLCLDPLSSPRLVARPAVIAKAAAALAPIVPPVPSAVEVRSTLLPPPSSPAEAAALAETDEFVARFLARISLPPAPRVPVEAHNTEHLQRSDGPSRMAPIAQFMLDELPNYKVRRSAASVPPPPAHAYVGSPALRLEPVEVDSPLALVESWLPPPIAGTAMDQVPTELAPMQLAPMELALTDLPPMELQWRAESPWSVLIPEPHLYRAVGWDSTRPAPLSVVTETQAQVAPVAVVEMVAAQPIEIEQAPASIDDPIVEVVQLMEIAPTPEAPAVQVAAATPGTEIPSTDGSAQENVVQRVDGDQAGASGAYPSFVAALSAVLLQRGATRGAAVIGSLLEGARVETSALGETLVQQLNHAGIGEQRGEHFLVAPAFAQAASGWKTLLSAESEDFSSCAETLDDWATRLVGALLPNPAPVKDIRRELRRQGVAAFGMLAAA